MIDLVEIHPRNNINLCLMGGMSEVMCLIFSHEDDRVKKTACSVFTSVVTNNLEVQNFASKSGAINLAGQLEREKTPQMRDAILGCLSMFLKAANFDGKRKYIFECNGLQQLSIWLRLDGDEAIARLGQGAVQRKIRMKLLNLLNDLVLNDDNINLEDPFYVRDQVNNDALLVQHLLDIISNANVEAPQEALLREYTLNTLYRLYQRNHSLKPRL